MMLMTLWRHVRSFSEGGQFRSDGFFVGKHSGLLMYVFFFSRTFANISMKRALPPVFELRLLSQISNRNLQIFIDAFFFDSTFIVRMKHFASLFIVFHSILRVFFSLHLFVFFFSHLLYAFLFHYFKMLILLKSVTNSFNAFTLYDTNTILFFDFFAGVCCCFSSLCSFSFRKKKKHIPIDHKRR